MDTLNTKPDRARPHNFSLIVRPENRTDDENGRRFASDHGAVVRYCGPWRKWFIWDGRRWLNDNTFAVEALTRRTSRNVWDEILAAITGADDKLKRELLAFGKNTSSTFGARAMLEKARSEPEIPILPERFDSHPWLFNCQNGTVDLKTGELLPHDREHYLTKLCPHNYPVGEDAKCPLWESTIDKIFGGNEQLIGFFRRWAGSAMVGEVVEHILAILWGTGSNGKSLIVETLIAALGYDYGEKGVPDLLLATKGDRHPTEKADLFGKRLVIVNETDDGRRLNEAVVKELTGGDTVKARRMREDFWSFKPSHTLALASNYKPIVRGTDHAIWRRLRLIPFTQRFWVRSKGETGPAEYEANQQLLADLRPELPGIVAWLVKACLEWQRDGLEQPDEVTTATADYRDAMDTVAQFLEECCLLKPDVTSKAMEVRGRYEAWCRDTGEHAVSARRFGEYLAGRGVTKRLSNGTWYCGVVLQ